MMNDRNARPVMREAYKGKYVVNGRTLSTKIETKGKALTQTSAHHVGL
jgi:hypothetical protein